MFCLPQIKWLVILSEKYISEEVVWGFASSLPFSGLLDTSYPVGYRGLLSLMQYFPFHPQSHLLVIENEEILVYISPYSCKASFLHMIV